MYKVLFSLNKPTFFIYSLQNLSNHPRVFEVQNPYHPGRKKGLGT